MANCLISYPNRVDEATLSAGSWGSTLANLQDRQLSLVARSADALTTSTVVRFAFATIAGVARADDCAARDPPPRTRRERDPTCRGLADWSCDATWCRSLQTFFTHHSVSIFDRVAFQLTDIYH